MKPPRARRSGPLSPCPPERPVLASSAGRSDPNPEHRRAAMTAHTQTDPTRPITRREAAAAAGIAVLALVVRLVYLYQIKGHPLFTRLTGDPAAYYERAMEILRGTPTPPHAFFHSSPLYPFFVALVARTLGPDLDSVRWVQACVGCVTVVLVFFLGRRTVGTGAGLVGSLLTAIYVPFVFFEAEYLEITLVLAFLIAMLLLLERATRSPEIPPALASGLFLGLAALGKPNVLLFAPIGALWLGLRRDPIPAGRSRGRRLAAVAFVVAAGAAITPATVHNYRTSGDLIPVSSNGGINLYIGNHAGAQGAFRVPPEMRFDLRVASHQAAERAVGHPLSAGEVSTFWSGRALEFIRAHPREWMSLMGRKLALFWNHYEIPNHYNIYFVETFAPILRIPIGSFAVIGPLGLAGLVLAWVRRRNVGLLVAFGLTYLLSVVPFFVTARYRLPIALVLLPGAGFALSEMAAMARRRQWRATGAVLVLVAVLAAGVNVHLIEFSFSPMYNTLGAVLGSKGDLGGAAREFTRALEADPADLSARYNLGRALLRLGRPREAARHFRLAVGLHPRYYEAWLGLGEASAMAGRTEEALRACDELLSMSPPAPPAIAAKAESLAAGLSAGGTP